MFEIICNSPCTLLSVTIDLEAHFRRYRYLAAGPKAYAMLIMLERFQDFLTSKGSQGISMWELISFHVVFMVCVIASARGVSSPQGLKNSDTYPFEALPHYHSSSICQNYFAISTARLSLNA